MPLFPNLLDELYMENHERMCVFELFMVFLCSNDKFHPNIYIIVGSQKDLE